MDIEFARTFLAVAAAGNFNAAAKRLHITQSTVSARIRTLENQLGVNLFLRGRSGAQLTAAGRRFLRHAKTLVRTLKQARHELGLPSGYRGSITLSARIALWEEFLPRWVDWMRTSIPDVSLRLEIGFEEDIMQGLVQGILDIGLMYTPESRPGMAVEQLFDEVLVLICTHPHRPWPDPDYIHVDWGPEFQAQFSARFPNQDTSAQAVNIGWLALQLILRRGGSAYLPLRMVREHLSQGRLWRKHAIPLIRLPVYMVYPLDRKETYLAQAVVGLRSLGEQEKQRQDG